MMDGAPKAIAPAKLLAFGWLFVFGTQCTGSSLGVPFFDVAYKMQITYRSWVDKTSIFCNRSCTGRDHKLGHRSHFVCDSGGVKFEEMFDYDNDAVYHIYADTGRVTRTTPIPLAEKNSPLYLLAFCVDGKGEASLLEKQMRIWEEEKTLNMEQHDLLSDVSVSAEGETYSCIMTTTVTRNNRGDKYCIGRDLQPEKCPCRPKTTLLVCGKDKVINASFRSITKEFDDTAFEFPTNYDNVTTADPTEEKRSTVHIAPSMPTIPPHANPTHYAEDELTPTIPECTVVWLWIAIVFIVATIVEAGVIFCCWRQNAALKKRNHYLEDANQGL